MTEFFPIGPRWFSELAKAGKEIIVPPASELFKVPAGWLSVFVALNRVGAARVDDWDGTEEAAGDNARHPPAPPTPSSGGLLAASPAGTWTYARRAFATEAEASAAYQADHAAYKAGLRAQKRLVAAREILSAALQKSDVYTAIWLPPTGDISPLAARFWRSVGGHPVLKSGFLQMDGRGGRDTGVVVIDEESLRRTLVGEPTSRCTNPAYVPPYVALLFEAIEAYGLSEDSQEKAQVLRDWFISKSSPSRPVSANLAASLATIVGSRSCGQVAMPTGCGARTGGAVSSGQQTKIT